MAESGCRDRSHLTLDLKGLKPTPNNDSGLSPIFTAMPLSPEKIQFGTQQQQQIQAQQPHQHHQILETPTPSNFFTKNPTSAQESFAEGFIEVFKKVQGSHATPINNSPSALKFLHTLFGHLSPNGTTKTFLGQEQQQPGIVSRLSPGTVAKDFLTQPIQQLPSPSGTANQQFLPGTDSSCALRLDVPQIVLTNTNNSNNNCGVNSDLISAAVAAAAAAATTAQQQSQQSPQQQQLNSPLSVGSTTAVVTGSAAGEDSSSPYSTAASSVNSVGDIGATTANTYMDYHLANLGQLSPAVTSAAGNNIAAGGVDFFQPQLAQFNSSAAIGLMAQQHPPKDIKREQPNNNAAVGIDHVILKQHAAAAAAATQLNGMPFVGMRGKLSSAARTNVLHSFQTHISPHHHHNNHHHHNAKSESYGGGRQNLKGADTGDQDMKKLERKRARNRLAASKCRQRKLQRITDLEQQVNEERERGSELQMQINQLQNVIRELEGRLKANEHQQQHMSIITHRQNS
ncbi:hypothetical protein niasHT_039957 [Heterodera trifolii]|uniref:BZIP domain-containing protein n=1 Tax=Heterodera trifolii TaxID=157864 RepID=A0ABD2IB66_9BILA